MFSIINSKGFYITFPNGITLSTQWGYQNYCDNQNYSKNYGAEKNENEFTCPNAEVACFGGDGRWLTKELFQKAGLGEITDDVKGYVDVETWTLLVAVCAKFHQVRL